MTPLFFFHSFRGLFSTKEEERVVRLVDDDDDAFSASRCLEEIFFCLLLRSKRRVSVKDTHFNTPTTNSIKYDDSKRFSLSLSLSLSLPLSPLESAVIIKGARKSTTVVVLSCFCENTTASTQRTYTASVCVSFFLCAFVHPTRLHTSDSRVCFNTRCSFLCVVLSSRPQKKKKKKEKKRNEFFLTEEFTTQILLLLTALNILRRRRRRQRQRQKDDGRKDDIDGVR